MNHLYLQLGRAIAGQCAPGFQEARLTAAPDAGVYALSCTAADGGRTAPPLAADAIQAIKAPLDEIRAAMAGEGGKSWRACTVTLVAGGGFSMEVAD